MKRLRVWVGLLALLVAHHAWILHHLERAYAAPDAQGYFVLARLLATGRRASFRLESPLQYVSVHWHRAPDGRFVCRYPPGYPALLAAAYRLGGPDLPVRVTPIFATLTLLFIFLLCRPWIGEPLALLAACLFAVHPEANGHAVHVDSHGTATCVILAGLWLLDRWGRSPSRGRAFLAGVVLGVVPALRYGEAVIAAVAAVFMLVHVGRRRERWPDLVLAAAGAALPVLAVLAYNQSVFGAVWRTGYRFTNEDIGFKLDALVRHLHPYLDELMSNGTGVFFGFGLAGLAVMLRQRPTRPLALLLAGVIGSLTAMYTAYYWGSVLTGALRFFLPTLPLYLLAALWFFRQHPTGAARLGLAVVALFQLGLGLVRSEDRLVCEQGPASRATRVLEWAETHAPAGSVIIAHRQVQDTLDYYGRWRLVESDLMATGHMSLWKMRAGKGYPSPMQQGKARALHARYEGLSPGAGVRRRLEDLLAWAGPDTPIFWLGQAAKVAAFNARLAGQPRFVKQGEIDLPQPSWIHAWWYQGGQVGPDRQRGGRALRWWNLFGPRADGRPLEVFRLEPRTRRSR